jgi:peptidoglycan/xylan/chitin deacetylase (PgdA/CDA1 family)
MRSFKLIVAFVAGALIAHANAQTCKGTLYLTLDTGNMRDAPAIAQTLLRQQVKATFFVANELTWPDRKVGALEAPFADYWRARVAEGHLFGSHTWRHGLISHANEGSVTYKPQFGDQAGQTLTLNAAAFCQELRKPGEAFEQMTGRKLSGLWRAPGGRTTQRSVELARQCGFEHVLWAPAGFLGDELPSEKFPNRVLLERALRDIRDGDILMAHLGIWSRKERFNDIFEPLIVGLKEKGFCFATLASHPQFKAASASLVATAKTP